MNRGVSNQQATRRGFPPPPTTPDPRAALPGASAASRSLILETARRERIYPKRKGGAPRQIFWGLVARWEVERNKNSSPRSAVLQGRGRAQVWPVGGQSGWRAGFSSHSPTRTRSPLLPWSRRFQCGHASTDQGEGWGSDLFGLYRKAHFLREQTSVVGGEVPGRGNLACLYWRDCPFPSEAGGWLQPVSRGPNSPSTQ